MNIAILIGMWIVGAGVGAFTLGQIAIILKYALPQCARLRNAGLMVSPVPSSRYLVSLLIIGVILLAITAAVVIWGGKHAQIGYFVGLAIAGIKSLTTPSNNANNVREFITSNREHLDPGFVAEMEAKLQAGTLNQ